MMWYSTISSPKTVPFKATSEQHVEDVDTVHRLTSVPLSDGYFNKPSCQVCPLTKSKEK